MTNVTTPIQITAAELRIGNWVNFEQHSIIVQGFKDGRVYIGHEPGNSKEIWLDIRGLDAIPLTTEILEKAGLVRFGMVSWKFDKYRFEFKHYEGIPENGPHLQLYVGDEWEYKFGKPLRHVHQFQNLYFALTGQQLNVEL